MVVDIKADIEGTRELSRQMRLTEREIDRALVVAQRKSGAKVRTTLKQSLRSQGVNVGKLRRRLKGGEGICVVGCEPGSSQVFQRST